MLDYWHTLKIKHGVLGVNINQTLEVANYSSKVQEHHKFITFSKNSSSFLILASLTAIVHKRSFHKQDCKNLIGFGEKLDPELKRCQKILPVKVQICPCLLFHHNVLNRFLD